MLRKRYSLEKKRSGNIFLTHHHPSIILQFSKSRSLFYSRQPSKLRNYHGIRFPPPVARRVSTLKSREKWDVAWKREGRGRKKAEEGKKDRPSLKYSRELPPRKVRIEAPPSPWEQPPWWCWLVVTGGVANTLEICSLRVIFETFQPSSGIEGGGTPLRNSVSTSAWLHASLFRFISEWGGRGEGGGRRGMLSVEKSLSYALFRDFQPPGWDSEWFRLNDPSLFHENMRIPCDRVVRSLGPLFFYYLDFFSPFFFLLRNWNFFYLIQSVRSFEYIIIHRYRKNTVQFCERVRLG